MSTRITFLSLAVAATGCAALEDAEELGVTEQAIIPPDREHQGRIFLGDQIDQLSPSGIDALSYDPYALEYMTGHIDRVRVEEGRLIPYDAWGDPLDVWELVGVVITHESTGRDVVVESVEDGLYLRWESSGDPVCADGGPVTVLPGKFADGGAYRDEIDRITFACSDGVIGKCVDWGYSVDITGPDYLEACGNMARANYCGDGVSYTFDGTEIGIYDDHPSTEKPVLPPEALTDPAFYGQPVSLPSTEEFFFEAAWRATEGEVGTTPLCLSKLRWQSLPLAGNCPNALQDPRFVGKEVRFCEEMTLDEMRSEGALLFNVSTILDEGLYMWRRAGGTDRMTTTRGVFADPGSYALQPPLSGYVPDRKVGNLFRKSGTNRAPLYRYTRSYVFFGGSSVDQLLATPATVPSGYALASSVADGYVATSAPAGSTTLKLYRKAGTTTSAPDYVTATSSPAAGYTFVTTIGYLYPP